eukprot:COSAG01_NODE_3714_length_5769_cov_15.948501_2_plen_1619_part_01
MTCVMSMQSSKEVSNSEAVMSAVVDLLSSLDSMAEGFVDRAEVMLATLRGGGEQASLVLSQVLEHGLEAMDSQRLWTPRSGRRAIGATSERVEELLDTLDTSRLVGQLSSCEESSLHMLSESLCAVEALRGGEDVDTGSVIACVEAMLDTLDESSDVALFSLRLIKSSGPTSDEDRMRALTVLRGLERVALEEVSEAERSVALAVWDVVDVQVSAGRNYAELEAAYTALYVMHLRSGRPSNRQARYGMVIDVLESCKPGREATFASFAQLAFVQNFHFDQRQCGHVNADNEKINKTFDDYVERLLRNPQAHEGARCILSFAEEGVTYEDDWLASGALLMVGTLTSRLPPFAAVVLASDLPQAALRLRQRVLASHLSPDWWKERSKKRDARLDICANVLQFFHSSAQNLGRLPQNDVWHEVLEDCMHMARVNQAAQLTACGCLVYPMYQWFSIMGVASRDQYWHPMLLQRGLVDSLLYASEHECVAFGASPAAAATSLAVNLIGRNESGITLPLKAISQVLAAFRMILDPSSRFKFYEIRRILPKVQAVVNISIADANKPHILAHSGTIDDLRIGLLLDTEHPRRQQAGAEHLQAACALAVQNLALSDAGKQPLQSDRKMMAALHLLSSNGQGNALCDDARQYASGALFELEAGAQRHSRKEGVSLLHVMLSYNWDHQDVIKRVHASLVRRGYTTWIDVEKMQGSTVEAMADAVEGAAVMCYGVSRAYKESANCRLEAQYAYQREKDMVPLLVEEGYRADGWLGMLMGTRLYYVFYGSTVSSDASLENKVEELCRELGDRGKGTDPAAKILSDRTTVVAVLGAGGEDAEAALEDALEHCLEALEALSSSTPRRKRKAIRAVCDRVEAALEAVDDLAGRLEGSEEATLAALAQHLCMLDCLKVGDGSVECVATVLAALDELGRHLDPVAAAGRALGSAELDARLRGLVVLASLPRVVLQEVVESEVMVAEAACQTLVGGSEKANVSVWLAIVALCFRNGIEATESVLASDTLWAAALEPIYALGAGELDTLDEVLLMGSATAAALLSLELASKFAGPARAAIERRFEPYLAQFHKRAFDLYSLARIRQLLPYLLEGMVHEDAVVASGVCYVVGCLYVFNKNAGTIDHLLSAEVLDHARVLHARVLEPAQQTSVDWWAARAEVRSLETLCLIGPTTLYFYQSGHFCRRNAILTALAPQWGEVIKFAMHSAKMIQEVKLSQRTRRACLHVVPMLVLRILLNISSIPSQRETLVSPGLVESLLYTVEHGNLFVTLNTAAFAAMTAVSLIGRNEGGLTLTRQAVDQVLHYFQSYFDRSSRRSSHPVKRMIGDTQTLVHLTVSDANKGYVIEHKGALDSLVAGLLLEESNPRRGQECAAELQQMCALVLQNLALSPIGAEPLRAHDGAMEALRRLASPTSGAAKSERARQSASGALFELEEETRKAVLLADRAASIDHIMLSYNWDHQDVIKRVHASLVRRGYTTWIDVEKMQGSTVEAMADAVEGAAVMCYGVSRAYKESANCRLEAQYAYQREKDMVPLLVEEGYRADGWLGMLMGTRLYYVFYGSTVSSDASLEGKVEELCREQASWWDVSSASPRIGTPITAPRDGAAVPSAVRCAPRLRG